MGQILLILQILVAVGLVALVMLQQGRGADAGAAFGSGGASTIFGARGPATLLTRLTAVFAALFFVNSIALAYVSRQQSLEVRSVVERHVETQPAQGAPGALDVPSAPAASGAAASGDVPAAPSGSGSQEQKSQ